MFSPRILQIDNFDPRVFCFGKLQLWTWYYSHVTILVLIMNFVNLQFRPSNSEYLHNGSLMFSLNKTNHPFCYLANPINQPNPKIKPDPVTKHPKPT